MASPKKTSSPSELKVWQHLLLLDLMRRKDALQQHIMDARQDLVRRITVLDHSDACLKKGFNLLEQEIRNHPVFAGIKTEEPIPTINNITSLPPIPTIDTITTASLPPNITNIPPIADGPLLDDIIHIKDEEPVLNDVTHRTSKSKPTPFQNVRKYKQGKKIRMNKDNKLNKNILKKHNKKKK
eukprot:418810_1